MKILLPTNIPLSPSLPEGVTAASYDPDAPVPAEHRDAEAVVAWGNNRASLDSLTQDLPQLRWVQSLAAGTEKLEAKLAADVVLTSGRGCHDRTVTEHALTLTLAGVRRIPQMLEAQREHRWATELGGLQPLRPEGTLTTLIGARVLVWGFGSIGQTLAPLLQGLGARVRGVARSAGERAGFPVIEEGSLLDELPQTDVLIMILPSTSATHHALGSEQLAALPRHAWVVNVGRGSTVDEAALVAALEGEEIGGAALDVTETEPLPADSPLWDAPRTLISPHAAGGRPVGADELISANAAAFLAGHAMRNVVER